MALNARQVALYTDTIDIYKPSDTEIIDREASDTRYPATASASGVKAKLFSSTEYAKTQEMGRTNEDMVLTFDKLHVEVAVDIDDAYYFQLKTAGHPDVNGWWVVMGNSKTRIDSGNRRPNYRQVLCKRAASAPPGVSI